MKLLAVVVALLFCACGTLRNYPGEVRTPDQVAEIRPAVAVDRDVRIEAVDDAPLGFFEYRAEVLPGEHTVAVHAIVHVGAYKAQVRRTLRFTAEGGRVYLIDADLVRNVGPRIWVVDATSGERVALAETRAPRPHVGAGPR